MTVIGSSSGKVIHVSSQAKDWGEGTAAAPFLTIGQAAAIAQPGDTVLVHQGTYREQVDPAYGGFNDLSRITYQAAPGERPVIKGSEVVNQWVRDGELWKAVLPNALFGDYNPYAKRIEGDWVEQPADWKPTLGEVYLNGKSFYQAASLAAARQAEKRTVGPGADWREYLYPLAHPEDTVYQWYAQVDSDASGQPDPTGNTTIWANFQGADPTDSQHNLVEVNVRQACFYPSRTGRNYITVRGFEMAQAACGWAPPTGDQVGLIGPHWSKGWIIEDNDLHDAKCSAVSLGKDYSTGDQEAFQQGRKTGHRAQLEDVFLGLQRGWDKETIGSHIVRNNKIHDCGQNGVVGHLGCVFSVIEGNDIFGIGIKREFFGHEIAGIKFHTPIDVIIRGNKIHACSLGTWLDWESQGTRITKNLYFDNERDLMIEVTHGPCLMDNNIFASERNIDNFAQGTAYVHNLFLGGWMSPRVLDRETPYHFPHSTNVRGYVCVYGGDDRFYNNLFVGRPDGYGPKEICFSGTANYNGSPTNFDDYLKQLHAEHDPLDVRNRFEVVKQPVYMGHNAYLNGSTAFESEQSAFTSPVDPQIKVSQEPDGSVWLEGDFEAGVLELPTAVIDTAALGYPRLTLEPYENPDGSPLTIDSDLTGRARSAQPTVGPVEGLVPGHNRVRLA